MKHLLLLITCLSLSFSTIAQRKHESGFVLKAGNFTFGDHQLTATGITGSYNVQEMNIRPGIMVTLGGYQFFRLGKHFSLSAELLYRYSNYSEVTATQQRYQQPTFGQFNFNFTEQKIWSESSIALPVRLHYSFRKNGRTSVSFGGGISRIIALERQEVQDFENLITARQSYQSTNWYKETQWESFENIWLLTAGVSRQISDNTRVALEFSFEEIRKVYPGLNYRYAYLDCLCDYYFADVRTPKLQNITVSLYHNLLR